MTKDQKNIASPEVLMLAGSHCSYCLPMIQVLGELLKAGDIAELRLVNIEQQPELATQFGVRSVPWLKIGPFELAGSRSKQEIKKWLQRAGSFDGISEYLDEMLSEGDLDAARKLIANYPQALENVIDLMADPEAKINVRLGIGVIIEEMAADEVFRPAVPRLLAYLSDTDARIRGDACHYLSLTEDTAHIKAIEGLLEDDSAEVREIAEDSLLELKQLL